MKKSLFALTVTVVLISAVAVFTACNHNPPEAFHPVPPELYVFY